MQTDDTERLNKTKKSVERFRYVIMAAVAFVLLLYFGWFGIRLGRGMADGAEAWGQFGDYFGGFLNPVIAYGAFYWLTQSFLQQSEELVETRRALKDASEAQANLARTSQLSVRVSILQAQVNAKTSDMEFARRELEFVAAQRDKPLRREEFGSVPVYSDPEIYKLDGTQLACADIQEYLKSKSEQLHALGQARDEILAQLNALVR